MFPDGSHGETVATIEAAAAVGPSLQPLSAGDLESMQQPQINRDPARLMSLSTAAVPAGQTADGGPLVNCPKCGNPTRYTHKGQKCPKCGTPVDAGEPDFDAVAGVFSQSPLQTMALNLSDGDDDDHPDTVKCPICKTKNDWSNTKCSNCKMSLEPSKKKMLNAAQESSESFLHLANYSTEERAEMVKKGWAMKGGKYPIKTAQDVENAVTLVGNGTASSAAVKAHIIKNAKRIGATAKLPDGWKTDSTQLSAEREHNVTVQVLQLDHNAADKDGLIWKVLCKTGTLALSPGPGQMDMDRPLNLTPDIFLAAKKAYDEHAFEHVTIPETHNNGTLENTGTVDHLDILNKDQVLGDVRLSSKAKQTFLNDPADTLYMLGGLNFSDPKVREKASNGSILNCSVGFKFNYRNKRTGNTYPVAVEHLALTNQPWVDGLGAFGSVNNLSGPFDQEAETPWDGVFSPTPTKPDNGPTPQNLPLSTPPTEVTLDPTMSGIKTPPNTADGAAPTLEMVLAQQTATLERQSRELALAQQQNAETQRKLVEQGRDLHNSQVARRVAELQGVGVTPAVLKRYQEIALAQYDAQVSGENTLQLSVREGDSTVTKSFDALGVAEYLLAAMPLGDAGQPNLYAVSQKLAADSIKLSQEQTEGLELSASQKADQIEMKLHPERFDAEGKRITRTGKAA